MSFAIAQLHRANHAGQFRAIGLRGKAGALSPFLGVDHYWMNGPTFPPHPHAGISAVSYLLLDSETGMTNRDSIGTDNLIRPGGKIRVPVGTFGNTRSPLVPPTEVTLLDVSLDSGAELTVPLAAGHTLFAMPIFGTVQVGDQCFDTEDLRAPVFPAQDARNNILIRAPRGGVKVVLFSGPPLSHL
ncbi:MULTISPECIES: pirin-like C-terminal cupin domain-containing protein [unclassified Achromobacter]|uniref:pirin-like C-terminal cupin domain-containing protein n=1 Tax=unclassified Achromobacter TaxID=2626865 RepID=UPI000B51B0F7|nr:MULTISPECIES: pirin-like C-terminal cupin domain-containing protein [unclassified Achromobacter]OWT80692.1 pirin [Achromobacter sp. HZ34]OWT81208.1 pirin [Achromobacter sp. HZ28]